MAVHVSQDRVWETTTSTGTGNVSLAGVVAGPYKTFASRCSDGDNVVYCISGQGASTEWETGVGHFVASGSQLARDLVLASSNSDNLVSFSAGTKDVFITISAERVWLPELSSDPAVPASGVWFYSKSVAGRRLPKWIGPAGIDNPVQPGFFAQSIFCTSPSNSTTAPNVIGGVLTTASTISHQQSAPASNQDIWQTVRRTRFASSTTAGTTTGMRTAYTQWAMSNLARKGGFFFRARFGQNINLNGGQMFVGLTATTGALAGDPSAMTNMCGMGYDAADSSGGNWKFMSNDGSGTATKTDLGASAARDTTSGYELTMYAKPGDSANLGVRVEELDSGTVVLDTTITTDLPAANTMMAMKAECRNGSVASSIAVEVARVYIETDY